MATSADLIHFFGIRHHGPGCARSLLQALEALQPDCLLVEGPPEGESLLPMLQSAELRPPVAMLVYMQDTPSQAAFYPFAEFSPEWQALQWASRNSVVTRFIDLPQTHAMAIELARREALKLAADAEDDAAQAGELAVEESPEDTALEDAGAEDASDAEAESIDAEVAAELPVEIHRDPLDWLAQAAGFEDGETWWNRLVEERGDSESLFESINEAMTAVRSELAKDGEHWRGEAYVQREALREAHMRQCIREATKAGYQRIAVVCGAWHVPALQQSVTAKADAALLKGLPKAKVQATWAPWTYRNLASRSGYGAGVTSPGWYEHLWRCYQADIESKKVVIQDEEALPAIKNRANGGVTPAILRTAGWLTRVAHLLREKDLDCSSAHIIEATRLAESLAALRGQPTPGLEEINESIVTVICMGENAPLQLIEDELTVGHVLGGVPADVPQVPLQRDMEQQQKSLRMKPEAASKLLALDLRKDIDLARSHFLHRLRLLGIDWGTRAQDAQRNRGTFRESWQLQWEPELAVRIIEASVHGATVAQAATAKLRASLKPDTALPEIAQAIDDALLANLPQLVEALIETLAERAATTGDVAQLLQALPPLANVYRYGSVRQTDTALLATVIDSLIVRASIGLPVACMAMDDDAAAAMKAKVLAAHDALRLRGTDGKAQEAVDAWRAALRSLAMGDAAAALLRGMACRLLLDEHLLESTEVVQQFNRNLSLGAAPMDVAAWLDGFLNQQALVLLHDESIWGAIDAWLSGLGEVQFAQILPLVRRSFANFSKHERQSLGEKAKRVPVSGSGVAAPLASNASDAGDAPWDEQRAALALPVLNALLGLNLPPALIDKALVATNFDASSAKVSR
ncbi:DUF5682 family protein [Comamonas suwonensis]|uniref:Uncharacterized protein n=1 Tax=Comamonas suwonensis TaxID=2606214 RepID=A0A843BFW7_9BURK|nr:DUF5682 family protein [Comamonas suwonensis]MBI1626138.1 hypothetical protein [Comamonas suwonensis]